jgi:hypothetical protein
MYDLKDLPAEFSQLSSLEQIKLLHFRFMTVPEPIFELTNLKKLKFRVKSRIHCVVCPKIAHLHQLQ